MAYIAFERKSPRQSAYFITHDPAEAFDFMTPEYANTVADLPNSGSGQKFILLDGVGRHWRLANWL